MIESNFRDWTLTKLDDAFGVEQILGENCEPFQKWKSLAQQQAVSEIENQILLNLQEPLQWGGTGWNEFEVENKFISPLMMQVRFDDRTIGYFLERKLEGIVGDYKLYGTVDGMIATGFRDPKKPFFCMQEFKRSMENAGRADAQALAAMLVAREINENKKPVYGMYIVGLIWSFMVLDGNEYCISRNYDSSTEGVFDIFRILKALKQIIKTELI